VARTLTVTRLDAMLRWIDEDHVVVGTTTLLTMGDLETIDAAALLRISRLRSTPERLVLLKKERMIESYLDTLERLRPRRVLELGIFQGGSIALVAETVAPDRLVAIELESDPVAVLESWIEQRSGPSRMKTHYGVDQTDTERLIGIVDADFDGPLDLVIDDASHFMPETRRSFNVLFPRLRPAGSTSWRTGRGPIAWTPLLR
jgi:predicted O-methyltransferase YrrM